MAQSFSHNQPSDAVRMSQLEPTTRAGIVLAPLLPSAVAAGIVSYLLGAMAAPLLGVDPSAPLQGQAGGLLLVLGSLATFVAFLAFGWVLCAVLVVWALIPKEIRSLQLAWRALRSGRYPPEMKRGGQR
jgi:hypothetical protein